MLPTDPQPIRRAKRPVNLVALGLLGAAALGAIHLRYPPASLATAPFAALLGSDALPLIRPSPNAYGLSGELRVRFALPEEKIEFPLEVHGDPTNLSYAWVRAGDSLIASSVRPLVGSDVRVPRRPGFYQLTLLRGVEQKLLEEISVAVMVPFSAKVGGSVNGYRIGTYLAERIGGRPTPDGFLEIMPDHLDMPVTRHLRVGDFVNHDRQRTWPKYSAVSPQLLEKVELVIAELQRWHDRPIELTVIVKSGFRSPDHNRLIRTAARDSRHQYGDAVDLAIDADGDGRITAQDARLVALAVEIVERRHPDLAGGLGLYTARHSPYVHIDARGTRVRWRG